MTFGESQRVNDTILRKKKKKNVAQMKPCLSWTSTGWQGYPTISYISHIKVPSPKKKLSTCSLQLFFPNLETLKTAENSEVREWWGSLGKILNPFNCGLNDAKNPSKSHGLDMIWLEQIPKHSPGEMLNCPSGTKKLQWTSGIQNCGSTE